MPNKKRSPLFRYSCGLLALAIYIFDVQAVGAEKKNSPPRVPPSAGGSEADFVTEKRSDGTTVKYKKKASYDFEGANIEGMYNKPSGSYISNIKDVKAKSIIRIRENFDAEVIDSSRLMK